MKQRLFRKFIWFAAYPLLARIRKYEDAYLGQECFVFGDGASLKYFDLSNFGDKVGIAVNAFPKHKDAGRTDLKFWVVAEAGFFLPPIVRSQKNNATNFVDRLRFQKFFKLEGNDHKIQFQFTSLSNIALGLNSKWVYFWDALPKKRSGRGFMSDKSSFAGSICAALTLAEYLGFRRAYLVGFDYTHNPTTSHHWYENAVTVKTPLEFGAYHQEFFKQISQFLEIITVTPVPQHTEFRSVDYKTFTGKELSYHKNVDLLSEESFRVLSSNPDYQMY